MVRLWNVESMRVSTEVLDKIRAEEQNHPRKEFGGFLVVKSNGYVKDIVFDMSSQSAGNVNLGASEVIKLNSRHRKMVKGWFHKHPINGLSPLDRNTIIKLTKFWGICYTMVLQRNGQMLLLKTVKGKEFGNRIANFNYNYGDFAEIDWGEIKVDWDIFKFWKKSPKKQPKNEDEHKDEEKEDKKPEKKLEEKPEKEDAVSETKEELMQLRPIDKELIVEVFRREIPFGVFEPKKSFVDRDKRFKIWDKVSKTMSNPFTLEMLLKENNIYFVGVTLTHDDIVNRLFRDNLTMLQYTGFVDINGLDIYEGDSVNFTTTFRIQKTGIVEFYKGAWKVRVDEYGNINWFDMYKETKTLEFVSNLESEKEEEKMDSTNNDY